MLKFEVGIWIVLLVVIIIVPINGIILKFFKWIGSFFKKIYVKFEYKKNLKKITEEIINQESESTDTDIQEKAPAEQPTVQEMKLKIKSLKLVNQRKFQKMENLKFEALALKERGNLEGYEKKLIEGLAIDGENFDFQKMLADLYFNLGNYTKALPLLKKILERQTTNHLVIWQVGQIYLEKGDYETSQLLIEKAITLKDDDPKYYVSLVEIMYNTDRLEKAIELMKNVLKLRPLNVNYLIGIATLYEDLGDIPNAKKYYFKVLEVDPANNIAKDKINDL